MRDHDIRDGMALLLQVVAHRVVNGRQFAWIGNRQNDREGYRGHDLRLVVPIQVKARTSTCYEFQKVWFRIPNLVLVQVWHVTSTPEFYIFGGLEDVVDALGPQHSTSQSWTAKGAYNVTTPNAGHIGRMRHHKDRWDKIVQKLKG